VHPVGLYKYVSKVVCRKTLLVYLTTLCCDSLDAGSSDSSVLSIAGYTHNPYNGVVCNDTILATGVFSSKELWRLSKGM
jgi:hypothetical protein